MAEIKVYNPLRDTIIPENYLPILRAWRDRPTLWGDLMKVPQYASMGSSMSGKIMVANALKPFLTLFASLQRKQSEGVPKMDHPNPTGLPQQQFQKWLDDAIECSSIIRAHRPFFNELRARTGWKGIAPDATLFDNLILCLAEATPHFEPRGMIGIVDAELFGNEVRMPSENRTFHGANIVKFFAAAAKQNADDEYDVEVDVAKPYSLQIAIYVVTGGHDCEDRARVCGEKKEAYNALLYDAIGSCVADTIALDLTIKVEREKLLQTRTNPDGSPANCVVRKLSVGYGDWPLEEQRDIFAILNATEHIGVELNDACLMIPEKSVSGLIGMKRK